MTILHLFCAIGVPMHVPIPAVSRTSDVPSGGVSPH